MTCKDRVAKDRATILTRGTELILILNKFLPRIFSSPVRKMQSFFSRLKPHLLV